MKHSLARCLDFRVSQKAVVKVLVGATDFLRLDSGKICSKFTQLSGLGKFTTRLTLLALGRSQTKRPAGVIDSSHASPSIGLLTTWKLAFEREREREKVTSFVSQSLQ